MIISHAIEKINVEKKSDFKGKTEIRNNLQLTNIQEFNIDTITEQKPLKISFSYTLDYEPNIASISFQGYILYIEEEKKLKEMLAEWNKSKSINPDIGTKLLSYIATKCHIKALSIADELNLPPHLTTFPILKPKK